MAQFNHPNIVALVGVCTLPPTEPTLIVLEYMHLGALLGYLQSSMVNGQLKCLTMIRMALDVGAGMQYLAESGFVVRMRCVVCACWSLWTAFLACFVSSRGSDQLYYNVHFCSCVSVLSVLL
jgi:hypothetical protein